MTESLEESIKTLTHEINSSIKRWKRADERINAELLRIKEVSESSRSSYDKVAYILACVREIEREQANQREAEGRANALRDSYFIVTGKWYGEEA